MELDDSLVESAALDVLGYYNLPGGWATGGFRSSLIATWTKADPANRARLSYGFPELGYVISLFQSGNTEAVQFLAKGGSHKELKKSGTHPHATQI